MTSDKPKILFLYTELADYFLACCEKLSEKAEVHIVRWPVNKEAPFEFNTNGDIHIYDKNDILKSCDLYDWILKLNPTKIVSSGWMDKDYYQAIQLNKKKIHSVLALDNHWNGSLKQHVAKLISSFKIKKYFTSAWVAGQPQKEYALKLGFLSEQIQTGFYVANSILFDQIFQDTFQVKVENAFPKKLLYVGRYIEHKGIFDLWNAFIELDQELDLDWELSCIGMGDKWDERIEHPKIKHHGFVQPKDLKIYVAESSVFVLPSHFEPWGVVVQEFALCGMPLLLSNQIGASTKFLQNGKNGFTFESQNKDSLKLALRKIFEADQKIIQQMGECSVDLGKSVSVENWVESALSGI